MPLSVNAHKKSHSTAHPVPFGQRHLGEKPILATIGLGYVGTVSTACFAKLGHDVIGVDLDPVKTELISKGRSPIVETGLGRLLSKYVRRERISVSSKVTEAVMKADISLVCVGTPSREDGSCDTTHLENVCREIGLALRWKVSRHTIVFRSTIPPGTTRDVLLPILETVSNKKAGLEFGVAFHPEFLRESTAVDDFFNPPKTVIGADDPETTALVASLYSGVDDHVITTSLEVAEMVKYVDNSWHAAKVCFANEVGKIAKSMHIDSHQVMDIFAQDTKLNISSYYMKPGFAFGGSCLPKDIRCLTHLARSGGVDVPLLNNLLSSNEAQLLHALKLIDASSPNRVGFLGLTFKPGTDDLRESPMLRLAALLNDEGHALSIYDPNLNLDSCIAHHEQHSRASQGTDDSILQMLPYLMAQSSEEIVETCDVVVLAHNDPAYVAAVNKRPAGCRVIDLARMFKTPPNDPDYEGICW